MPTVLSPQQYLTPAHAVVHRLVLKGGLERPSSSMCSSDENRGGNWGTVQKGKGSQTLPSGATKGEMPLMSLKEKRKKSTSNFTIKVTYRPTYSASHPLGEAESPKAKAKHTWALVHNSWPQKRRRNWFLKCFFRTWTFTSLKSECTSLNQRTKITHTLSLYKRDPYPRTTLLSAPLDVPTLEQGFICRAVSKSKICSKEREPRLHPGNATSNPTSCFFFFS